MRHEAHVRFIDAHAERDGGDDYDAILVDEAILMAGTQAGIEARMIGQRLDARLAQRGGDVFDLGARQAIDDAGVAGMALADEGLELRRRVLLLDDLVSDIRPIETRDKTWRAGKPEPLDDLLSRELIGGSGQRDPRHVRKTLGDDRQADVFRAKVVPPLRHAMRLVDRKQGDISAIEQIETTRRQKPLRRNVQQIEVSGDEPRLDRGGFAEG